jgi:hypothetical protein
LRITALWADWCFCLRRIGLTDYRVQFRKSAMAMDAAAAESSLATEENLKLQAEVRDLTVHIKTLTIVLLVLGVLQLLTALVQTYPVIHSLLQPTQASNQRK